MLSGLIGLTTSTGARAEANVTCGLTVEIIAAPFAVVDSNKPGVEGPMVGTMGARIVNTSGSSISNLSAYIGNGSTPGSFPASAGGSLSLLDSGDAEHYLGDLGPGETTTVYWPLTYPPTYDVSYGYTIWTGSPANCVQSASSQLTTQSEISATANKLQPTNGMIVVSPSTATPGSTLSVKVIGFELGTIGQGPRPLSPYDAWLQPIGNLDFDTSCMRLVRTEAKLNSLSSTPYVDRLYFSGIGSYNYNASDYVEYTYVALRDCTTAIQPYQEAASGTQEKYNADYNSNRITIQSGGRTTLKLNVSTDTGTLGANETLNVAVQVAADSGTVGYPDNGSPVVVTSSVPDGTSYVSGSTTTTAPATIQYSTNDSNTWLAGEPADAGSVTDIRWILDEAVDTTTETLSYSLLTDAGYDGSMLIIEAGANLLDAPTLTSGSLAVNGTLPDPEPTPDPETIVQSGGSGGLESGPLEGDPSDFIGGIGGDNVNAASVNEGQVFHKARLLEQMSLSVEDILPANGPAGTTAEEAVPVDVLAFTTAPDATATDFVDSDGNVRAVALGINSVGGPYEHDYGVCNRFKTYAFETIEPVSLNLNARGAQGDYWFWRTVSTRGETVREDALIFHIFVDEASKTFHIDSRWIMNDYPETFDYDFDYVFNMQLWSSDTETTRELLDGVLNKMASIDGGQWNFQFHNTSRPVSPQVFIESTDYRADNVIVTLRNVASSPQEINLDVVWRNHVERNETSKFELDLTLGMGETSISLPLPGLLDVTLWLEHNGFSDKIYTGGGLWFNFAGNNAESKMELGQCRTLDGIDAEDLMLAGCADIEGSNITGENQVGLGRTLNPNGRPVDVSPYRALRFWAKGDGLPVRVTLESAGIGDGDYYQTVFTPVNEWRQYILPLDEFTQRGFGAPATFTGTDVKAVIWTNVSSIAGASRLWVDQVSFTNHGLVAAENVPADTADTSGRTITVSADDGTAVAEMTIRYSLDDGATFLSAPLSQTESGDFSGQIPGQDVGSDVLFYVEARHVNGYASQSPIDAPASLYRYRVDDRNGMLIDDFAGERLRNRQGSATGVFNNGEAGGQVQVYRHSRTLTMVYDVQQPEQFAGYFSKLNEMDASAYTTLNLLVKGREGGEQLLVGLKDNEGRESKISVGDVMPGGVTSQWRWVQIPLAGYKDAVNLGALDNMSLSFQNGRGKAAGRISIGEIRFTSLTSAIVVDRFDDMNGERNGQGLGYVESAPGAALNVEYSSGDVFTATGGALQLSYDVPLGGYAFWSSRLRGVAAPPDGNLVLWVRGGEQAIDPHIYLGDGSVRARVALSEYVTVAPRWQQVRIPLAKFAEQGVTLAALQSVDIVFEFAQGSGTLWVDNITLERAGTLQAERRVFHMNDRDLRPLALHTSGGSWQVRGDSEWLTASGLTQGASNVDIHTVNFGLEPGAYTGTLLFSGENGAEERMTVYLTVTEKHPAATKIYLPLIGR